MSFLKKKPADRFLTIIKLGILKYNFPEDVWHVEWKIYLSERTISICDRIERVDFTIRSFYDSRQSIS